MIEQDKQNKYFARRVNSTNYTKRNHIYFYALDPVNSMAKSSEISHNILVWAKFLNMTTTYSSKSTYLHSVVGEVKETKSKNIHN